MAAIPPHPWLPAFSTNYSGGGGGGGGGGGVLSSSAHLVTFASALRLGDIIHLRCTAHLHLLLTPHSPEGYHFGNFDRIHNTWHPRRYLLKRYSLLKTLADAFSTSCSSCFSFFGGSESEEGQGKQRSHSKSSEGNRPSGRLWTNVILALNIIVYVAQVTSQGRLTLWGAKVNGLINKGQLWRLATSSFLHANIGHLMVNCYSLNSIGPTVEQLSGPRRFFAVYFTSAIASSLMSYRYCQSPAVGASGAIFGLVGSLAVFVLRHKSLLGGGKQDLQQIARVIALNMVIGLLSRGIDNWGHLGGLLGGAAMSWFLGPAWKFEFRCDDGRSVFVDRPPIFHFINNRRLS